MEWFSVGIGVIRGCWTLWGHCRSSGFVALRRKAESKVFPVHALIVCSGRRVTAPAILILVARSR